MSPDRILRWATVSLCVWFRLQSFADPPQNNSYDLPAVFGFDCDNFVFGILRHENVSVTVAPEARDR
jgi:hypothetical protein